MSFELLKTPQTAHSSLTPLEKVAIAAAIWVDMGIDVIPLVNQSPIDDTRTYEERKSPVDTYFWFLKQPPHVHFSIMTGRKSGLVALSVYTSCQDTGLNVLEQHGFFCRCCDTAIRHETFSDGQCEGGFHTVLFYCGKDQFLETVLEEIPGVIVRASGEQVLLPPCKLEFSCEFNLVMQHSYEDPALLAPVGITHLPDDLRKIIRKAERQKLAKERKPKPRGKVLQELYTPVPEGKRNNTLTRRAGYLLGSRKLSEKQALRALLDINQTCCKPPLPIREVESVVRSIAKRHRQNG